MSIDHAQIEKLCTEASAGESESADQLIALVYADLRSRAEKLMAHGPATASWQPTAVVHEAYLRMLRQDCQWQARTQFFSVAADMMWRVLADMAKARKAKKRGGELSRITLSPEIVGELATDPALEDLADALERLEQVHPRYARIARLRFLAGLSLEETAGTLDVSTSTIEKDWRVARAWLRRELTAPEPRDS